MEKINVAELLKDCPKGMELDCINYNGVVTFEEIFNCPNYPIKISIKYDNEYFTHTLTKYGQTCKSPYNKCIIFPKGKTTWEGFQRPFKDGDIVFYDNCVFIFKEWVDETLLRTYAYTYLGYEETLCKEKPVFGKDIRKEVRFATEEEKSKLFYSIKANDYKWNPETKTIEKLMEPKFKVGDKVRHKDDKTVITITGIKDDYYFIQFYNIRRSDYQNEKVSFKDQDKYELVSNKFDITTLVPFESRVLVRNDKDQYWIPAFWGCKHKNGYTTTFGWCKYCIPHEGNEHLLETNNDCEEYFKTWK